jgi:hypothetical protein
MGTYSIIYLKKPEMAKEVNNLLKEKYNLKYESYNGIEYGIFFTQEMFDEDLRFMNKDEEGKQNLSHYQRPISKETYHLLLFGIGNCFGDIGTFCVKISCIAEEEIKTIKVLQEFFKTPEFKKYVNIRKSKNLRQLLNTKV